MFASRVLIYRLGSLGDTIVALPCLHLIARAFPKAERLILTSVPVNNKAPAIDSVLGESGLANGYITYSYTIPGLKCLYKLCSIIRKWRPDVLVYLPGQRKLMRIIRDVIFFKFCGIKEIIGVPYAMALRQNRLLPDRLSFEHEAARLARCIGILGEAYLESPNSWNLLLTQRECQAAEQILGGWEAGSNFIACSIGTKFEVNDWGNQNWKTLLGLLSKKYIEYGLIILGSSDEFNRSQELCQAWGGPSLNLCGRVTLRVASAILKRAFLFLGHDSGLTHLAATFDVPCVAIYSARNKPGIWFPYGASHRVIYHKTECFGCGLTICKKYKKKCINSISVSEIFDAICKMLDGYGSINSYNKL